VLESFDEEELAATAVELLTDTERLKGMRRRGREYVAAEHSPERMRELLRSAFDDLERAS
jgi:glycosyltransferase involved in cell wall biosynthesis